MITLDKSSTNLLLQALQSQATLWRTARQRWLDGRATPDSERAVDLLTEQLHAADRLALQMVAANTIALFPVPEVSTLKRAVTEPLPALCPTCSDVLQEIGDAGIADYDGRWEAQTTRYRCGKGHMVFVTDADGVDDGESDAAVNDDAFPLTDAVVDAFLAQLDEVGDPARVERIRQLFIDKLKKSH